MSTEEINVTDDERDILKAGTQHTIIYAITQDARKTCNRMVKRGWLRKIVRYSSDYALTDAGRAVARQLGIEKGGGM